MNKNKVFLSKKSLGFYFVVAAILFLLLSMIFAISTGSQEGDLTAGIVVLYIIAILAAGVAIYRDFFGIELLVSCVCAGAGYMMLLVPRLNMIGLILNGVVENEISSALIASLVFLVLAMICNSVCGFIGAEKKVKDDVKAEVADVEA